MNTAIPVGVLGASGYAGRELCGLIARHPRFELAFATANEQRGQQLRIGDRSVTFAAPDDVALGDAALVFAALPHGASLPWVVRARSAGARVVDLSSDLRPGHGDGSIRAAYGMPELGEATRAAVHAADIVANPGCYPTSILLAIAPLL
ncbi:MAG: N-acetyl-gamma-glutamyl-phosphate reductase, partial [Gemmatimonadaceae bacterium]|nr:N-acetyl-gamma-glutamyl-phosphate reductase [Gemmatimonadaceae bacterium]